MMHGPQNRIEELAERSLFRLTDLQSEYYRDEARSVSQENTLNTFRSSKNQKTLKGSREKEPAIE